MIMSALSDRGWDKRLKIKTAGREDESSANYSPYEPTPYRVLERLRESGYIKRKDHLLDYGCGKGRVAFYMAATVGCRVTGLDYSQKLIDIAMENRRSSGLGDRVRLVRDLAERYAPREENAFFLFNPFSEVVFEGVLRNLRRYARETRRALTLLCYYPSEAYVRCLMASEDFLPVDEIDCGDLFNGSDPRERVIVYRHVPV